MNNKVPDNLPNGGRITASYGYLIGQPKEPDNSVPASTSMRGIELQLRGYHAALTSEEPFENKSGEIVIEG